MQDIGHIVYKYIRGEASAQEKKQVILWLEEDPAHAEEYLNLRKLVDLNIWSIDTTYNSTQSLVKKKPFLSRKISFELLKIASVFIIGILVSLIWVSRNDFQTELQTVYVPHGQRTELFLSDGTQVWLNSGTVFKFPNQFARKSREVELDGEAYFKVAKDEKIPFVVHSGKYNIKVIGTEFNIKSYIHKDIFETALINGGVEVNIPEYTNSVLLKPHEIICKIEKGYRKSRINDYNYFKWREGLLCFEQEKVESLFRKLELYYDIKIEVKNKLLLDYSYTGKFRIRDGIEHVLKVLQVKHKFKYKRNDDQNMIVIE